MIAANAVMVIFLYTMSADWQSWAEWEVGTQVWQMVIQVLGGIGIYCLMLFITGLRWRHIYR